ncbi:uncharacterized protein [Blastocystis hominis]|uniref:Uncharacterized protein n=1 Tax=Blastocystis hominis TaxID=12968 RepID=D8LZ92_BLAHO|nr:uncharacterized protein [Blastocystis hominis]CBK21131.2 unnamed protein product [Blastocystis hominis]|eukprot:XP_012895179.1 uncharacterized protein [Blastocystis hominis]
MKVSTRFHSFHHRNLVVSASSSTISTSKILTPSASRSPSLKAVESPPPALDPTSLTSTCPTSWSSVSFSSF